MGLLGFSGCVSFFDSVAAASSASLYCFSSIRALNRSINCLTFSWLRVRDSRVNSRSLAAARFSNRCCRACSNSILRRVPSRNAVWSWSTYWLRTSGSSAAVCRTFSSVIFNCCNAASGSVLISERAWLIEFCTSA